MAYNVPTNKYVRSANADYWNNIDRFTAIIWGRLPSLSATKNQHLWKHGSEVSGGNAILLRRDRTSTKWRASTVVGGVTVTKESAAAVVDNQTYHIAVTWQKNVANGLKLFIDGVEDGTGTSTTTQTANYDSGLSTDSLWFGARHATSDLGEVIVEGFAGWPGVLLTAQQIADLRNVGWPWLVGVAEPSVMYQFDGINLSFLPDLSPGRHHIDSTGIISGVTDFGKLIGFWEDEDLPEPDFFVSSAANPAPPSPDPWTQYPTLFDHPAMSGTLSGLEAGEEYEIALAARDAAGNESAMSAALTAVAGLGGGVGGTGVIHHPKFVRFGH